MEAMDARAASGPQGPGTVAHPGSTAVAHPGLSEAEADARLARVGPNELPRPRREPLARRLARHLLEPMALLLLAAAGVSGIWLGERIEAVAILAIVVLNAAIGLFQEGKAARALEALRAMESPSARVRRDGRAITIPAREVVPGDIALLAGGDRVPADVRLVETSSFEVDESLLTGESLPVPKDARARIDPEAGLADRPWLAYAGTHATRGTALGVVEATGAGTALGVIAVELEGRPTATPLQRDLAALTTRLGIIAVAIAAAVFGLTLLRTGLDAEGINRSFLTAVALAVAAVPEGLATVVAVALALGVRRMASRGAIVRRLPAVETLGSTTVILTDKTGTLTENRMHVGDVLMWDGPPVEARAREAVERVAVLCNDAELDPPSGDPLEVALLEMAGAERVEHLRGIGERVGEIPFDAERRRMDVAHRADGVLRLLIKGAPETVLELSARLMEPDGSITPLDDERRTRVLEAVDALAARGTRVIALAEKPLDTTPGDLEEAEHGATLVALVGLRDRVRDEARATVEEARSAGIDVIMVTGDHAATARAVADEVGIAEVDAATLTGLEMRARGIPDDPRSVRVYARVDPDEKLALVERLQERGEVLAVTGDGVNDAPALRRADIGVAMGRGGSDVARQASDMVVTDDNLATIVSAVREGRGIFENIRKVVDYLVAGNISEIAVVVFALLLFPDLGIPLLPLQLLWINLLTDGLPALALGVDTMTHDLMRRPPRPRSYRLLSARRIGFLSSRASLIAAASLAALSVSRYARGLSWDESRATMFTVLVVAHLLWAFQARYPRWRDDAEPVRRTTTDRLARERWLLGAIGLGLALQAMIVVWPAAHEVFDTATLDVTGWVLVLVAGGLPAAIMGFVRAIRFRS